MTLTSSGILAQSGLLLVAQKGDQSLAIVDPVAGKVLASVPEGGNTGHEVTASPDGRFAYVPVYGNSGVGKPGTDGTNMVVIDLAARKDRRQRRLRPRRAPALPGLRAQGRTALRHHRARPDGHRSSIPKTLKIVGSIPTGQPESHMLALSHDGRRGYTANVGPGTVSVLDMEARKTLTVIPISRNTQRISISMDDKWVFTADQTQPRMAVIDTATNAVKTWIPMAGVGYGSAPTPDGKWLLVALPDVNKVAVIDLGTMKVARNIDVAAYPQAIAVSPDGKTAYASCMHADKVAEMDIASGKTTREIATGKQTDGLAWAAAQ